MGIMGFPLILALLSSQLSLWSISQRYPWLFVVYTTLTLDPNRQSAHRRTINSPGTMRYQHLLLSALASLVVAENDGTPRNLDHPASDALPVVELRDVPVLPHIFTIKAVPQDISPQIMAANTYGHSGSKLKRTPSVAAHQPHKRAACDPLPTLPNTYNINLSNAQAFRSDPSAASVANAANPSPTGYYQSFTNLQAATDTISSLGRVIVNTTAGYDPSFCAAKCNALSNCLAFNIFFERSPTQTPGPNCPNPPAFANIKCSLWGTAINASTATNRGSRNRQFDSAIAGSNGYISWRFAGPIEGWKSPQTLNTSIMNAPLRDCTGTWTYLGYKLFQNQVNQPASNLIDPRLCATACDEQSAYNKAHPARGGPNNSILPPVACNAFGSYILIKTNVTKGRSVSFEVGQMCTLYTEFWNETFAVNRVAFDDGVGARYSYGFSTFYGREKGLDCKGKV